ncbi:uncharacterized protein [Triticum aestivum]|uniref:uncharacterized protein isoform X2 n=1 Tax=Triticum aestivum TaxID=4565 RepID=UPI001D02ED8A|nr:uncharacterized protein LOC123054554 isoform X2 [Triticum aestivum]
MTQNDRTLKLKPLEIETQTLLKSRQRCRANGMLLDQYSTGDVVACSSKLPLVYHLLFCLSRRVTTGSSWQGKHSMDLKALILKEGNYSKVNQPLGLLRKTPSDFKVARSNSKISTNARGIPATNARAKGKDNEAAINRLKSY